MALLHLALTHPSLAKEQSNQRLEFLGDSVLGAVVAHLLYQLFPNEQEGELARRLAALVRGETLTLIAREIDLAAALRLAAGEARDNSSNLEDALEALIGAIYLDGGFDAASSFITPRWKPLAEKTIAPPKDAKTALQEWAQGRGLPIPVYSVLETTGPAHAPLFTVEVQVQGQAPTSAQANAKRAAEQLAAAELLERVKND
ncbi:MAG: ribonuclease III [Alphaproteobacteria bacterium]|nr:ribonuclease III [Alphaproteobacteria bacterium]